MLPASSSVPATVESSTSSLTKQEIIVPISVLGRNLPLVTHSGSNVPTLLPKPTIITPRPIVGNVQPNTSLEGVISLISNSGTNLFGSALLSLPPGFQQRPDMSQLQHSVNGPIPGLDPLMGNAIINSTTATFISQLATNISGSLMSVATSAITKGSNSDILSSLREVAQLLTTMSSLTANLNNSVSSMIAITKTRCSVPIQIVTSTADVANPTVSNPQSNQQGTLKALLTRPSPQGDSEEENRPTDQAETLSSGKTHLPPRKKSRRVLSQSASSEGANQRIGE